MVEEFEIFCKQGNNGRYPLLGRLSDKWEEKLKYIYIYINKQAVII
jgi:hypothetical protein